MAKYSFEFKKEIVTRYLNKEGGYQYLARKYNIPKGYVAKWVNAYKQFGDKGITRSRRRREFSYEFKMEVVERYLSSELSYEEVGLEYDISQIATICNWVQRYRAAGPNGLKPQRKGRPSKMAKKKKTKTKDDNVLNYEQERIALLEKENLELRVRIACLKEARRLRLEEEAQQNANQE